MHGHGWMNDVILSDTFESHDFITFVVYTKKKDFDRSAIMCNIHSEALSVYIWEVGK